MTDDAFQDSRSTFSSDISDGILIEAEQRILTDTEAAQMDRDDRIRDRFSVPRHLVERKSDDPFGAIWRELQRFSGDDAARRVMTSRGVEDVGRLRGLRNEIRLGDAFYIAYRDADEVIDPVLLYYGAYSLAKAICFAGLDETGFVTWRKRPTHGISSRTGSSLLTSRVAFQETGTVQSFANALSGHAPRNVEMDAIDFFRAIPELDSMLRDIGLGGTSALRVFAVDGEDQNIRFFQREQSIQLLVDTRGEHIADFLEREVPIFQALIARGARFGNFAPQISWDARVGGVDELFGMTMRTPVGLFFERRFSGGYYIPEMAVHLILLHLLADFSRYQPDKWIDMVDHHTDEYALAREFIHVSEYKFPNLVLNELTRKIYAFLHY